MQLEIGAAGGSRAGRGRRTAKSSRTRLKILFIHMMKINQNGIDAIRQREGVRDDAYQDSRGIWTIGVGHTGPEIHRGLQWTDEQINAALEKDIAWAEAEVNRCVTVPLTQNQFNSFVSFTFNVGKTGFDHSSALRDFNSGVIKAANDLLMWEQPPVLKGRRESERTQFLTPES